MTAYTCKDTLNAALAGFAGCKAFVDGTGKIRTRFRPRDGKPAYTTLEPGTADFAVWYDACITGTTAQIVRLPGAAKPKTFAHAYQLLKADTSFKKLDDRTRALMLPIVEAWLDTKVDAKFNLLWRDATMDVMDYGMCQRAVTGAADMYLAARVAAHATKSPERQKADAHKLVANKDAGRQLHVAFRKLFKIARQQSPSWVKFDPTFGIEVDRPNPAMSRLKPWSYEAQLQYEAFFPIGTAERTLYELAKWLGSRVSDCGQVAWEHRTLEPVDGVLTLGYRFVEHKKRKYAESQFQATTDELEAALAHVPQAERKGVILKKANGEAYAFEYLSNAMARWTRRAGLAKGHTLHGIRKNMGHDMAAGGATLKESMAGLAHLTPQESLRYSMSYEQTRGAVAAKGKVVDFRRKRAELFAAQLQKAG
jgi:hypothetical protein